MDNYTAAERCRKSLIEGMTLVSASEILKVSYNKLEERYESLPESMKKWCMDYLRELCIDKGKLIEKTIEFTNDDVPDYLEMLDRWENRSSKIKIKVMRSNIEKVSEETRKFLEDLAKAEEATKKHSIHFGALESVA